MSSYFVGIENAKTSERLPYFKPGSYELILDVAKVFPSRKHGPMFVSEWTITKSEGEGANPAGTRAAQLIKLSADTALGNIKGLVGALTGEGPSKVTQAMCDNLVSEKNPAKGSRAKAFVHITLTKAGEDFTLVQYEPFVDQSASNKKSTTKAA